VINKIDREQARVPEVIGMVQDMFLELATEPEQLDFPVIYTSARDGYAVADMADPHVDMKPLFEAILNTVHPPSGNQDGPLQMLVAALDYDNYVGQIGIGRITRGTLHARTPVVHIDRDGQTHSDTLEKVYVFHGLERLEVLSAQVGDIVAVTGVENLSIGDTIADPDCPEALPTITIEEPTVKMSFGVNSSPMMGKEGSYCTSRNLHERLLKELRTNVSLRVESTLLPDEFLVSGRGELHLSILVETMRREGYEFQVSKPEPVTKIVDGQVLEPYEHLSIETREEFIGPLSESLSGRLAQLVDMKNDGIGNVHIEYRIPTRGLIGFRSFFLRTTRGDGVNNSQFIGYEPMSGVLKDITAGVLVASEGGMAVTYGLLNAQGRGSTFIDPGTTVYEGMIVGMHPKDGDIPINVCREKKLTNMRSSTADIAKRLSPPMKMSLEEALDFISSDELVELTPKNFRLRKKELTFGERHRLRR
jgi:GTP-binding protein